MVAESSSPALDMLQAMRQPIEDAAPGWPEPVDFLADHSATSAPDLLPEHLPPALVGFCFDTAARLGVDPAAVALSCLVVLSSVATDDWAIQPKQHDTTWTERPRLWGAIVGDPSRLKTPILNAAKRPLDRIDAEARQQHQDDVRRHKAALKAWKDAGSDPEAEPKEPRLARFMVESTTVEALTEVLRDGAGATQHAPAKKVLVFQDELTEWVAGMDRYRSGGKGNADRGAYLRLFNGGRHSIDRIGRGSFATSNWSACVLGGIQPDPIRSIARDADDDGLLQRFCFCVPAFQSRGEDRTPSHADIERYDALVRAMVALHPPRGDKGYPLAVKLPDGAKEIREGLLSLVDSVTNLPDTSSRLTSALGKFSGLWARLVLLFHLIEHADARAQQIQPPGHLLVVRLETVQQATAYLRSSLLPHRLRAEAIMFDSVQSGHARWIADWILSRRIQTIAIRDVQRAYRPLKSPEKRTELLAVMQTLTDFAWLSPEADADPARPAAWVVNPRTHRSFQERAAREQQRRHEQREKIALAVEFLRSLRAQPSTH